MTEKILKRLSALAPTLFFPQQAPRERAQIQQSYDRMKAQFQRLDALLGQVCGHDP